MKTLRLNDVIEVSGFIMLKGMEGKLKVSKVDEISYWFTKMKGVKVVARHLKTDIDSWIDFNSEYNYIKIIQS